jgi:hypothetical protein
MKSGVDLDIRANEPVSESGLSAPIRMRSMVRIHLAPPPSFSLVREFSLASSSSPVFRATNHRVLNGSPGH